MSQAPTPFSPSILQLFPTRTALHARKYFTPLHRHSPASHSFTGRPSTPATPHTARTRQSRRRHNSIALPIMSDNFFFADQPLADPSEFEIDWEEYLNSDWAAVDDATQER